jgi:hypothetical protein
VSRRDILADTLARLEAERFSASPRPPKFTPRGPAVVTPEQAAQNRADLLAAFSDEPERKPIVWRGGMVKRAAPRRQRGAA